MTEGWKRITLAVGVDIGVAVAVGLTGHALAVKVAVGANISSTTTGASPLCAIAQIGRRTADSVINQSQALPLLFVENCTR